MNYQNDWINKLVYTRSHGRCQAEEGVILTHASSWEPSSSWWLLTGQWLCNAGQWCWATRCLRKVKQSTANILHSACRNCWLPLGMLLGSKSNNYVDLCNPAGEAGDSPITPATKSLKWSWLVDLIGGLSLQEGGDQRVCSINRYIKLLSHYSAYPGKIYMRLLERIMHLTGKPGVYEEQCRFHWGRRTLEQLYTVMGVCSTSPHVLYGFGFNCIPWRILLGLGGVCGPFFKDCLAPCVIDVGGWLPAVSQSAPTDDVVMLVSWSQDLQCALC